MSKKMTAQDWHDEYFKALARERELVEAMEQIFEHCALVQKVWGDGAINVTPIIERAEKAIAKSKGE